MSDKPVDFLIIGAQKSATTWLDGILRQHPDVWMPPKKELHYFDAAPKYPAQPYLYFHPIKRLYKRKLRSVFYTHVKHAFRKTIKAFLKNPTLQTLSEIFWCVRYFFLPASDAWYISLFKLGAGKIKGEASPEYSILDLDDVKKIHALLPGVKIIFLMRNPIDRAWSHARFALARRTRLDIKNLQETKQFIDRSGQELRSDYPRTLKNWEQCFPADRVFIGFYDDVVNNPSALIERVFQFLAIDGGKLPASVQLSEQKNVSRKVDFPPELRFYLSQKYLADLEHLANRFEGHPKNWLNQARLVLKDGARET